MKSDIPLLLIFGLPRSGTTWLGKIFDSHPGTLYRHEPDYFPQLKSVARYPQLQDADQYTDFLRDFAACLALRNEAYVVAKMPLFPKYWQNRLRYNLLRTSALATKLGERAGVKLPVLGARVSRRKVPSLVVWKSIESMGRFGLAMCVLDSVRGIHLLRHPCGHINSVIKGEGQSKFCSDSPNSELYNLFGQLMQTPQAQRRGLSLDYLRGLTPVQRLAWRWVLVNEKAIEDTTGSDCVRTVCYEDICAEPVEMARDLFNFAELSWQQQSAGFVGQSVKIEKNAYYSVYKEPRHAMSKWRDELADKDIEQILAILEDSFLADFYREEKTNVQR